MQGSSRIRQMFWWWMMVVALTSSTALADPIPELLKPWTDWVMRDQTNWRCSMAHDQSEQRWCAWPSRLTLTLERQTGRFRQQIQTQDRIRVVLPGQEGFWPEQVHLNDKPATITSHNDLPGIWLPPGTHLVTGIWNYSTLPEWLRIPPESGLISLTVEGRPIPMAAPDADGRLWLHPVRAESHAEERLELSVQRLIRDGVPVILESLIEVRVSGPARPVLLPPSLAQSRMLMNLESPLPVRLDDAGQMTIQIKPGVWTIRLQERLPEPVHALTRPKDPQPPWPEQEIWALAANPAIRMVNVAGVEAVDPRQTELPQAWRTFPAYRVGPGATMQLVEQKRGVADPMPDQLTLTRSIWLDFSGEGWTIQDHIQGTSHQNWRLEMAPPLELGRVVIQGENQFITRMPDSNRRGVALPHQRVNLTAESRLPVFARGELPATGWQQDFQKVSATLHLPPGWRLWHASGMDRHSHSWVGQWTLLDLFVVLLLALTSSRLWGRWWGSVTLVAMVLIHPEGSALSWILLLLMAIAALQRVTPETGWPARLLGTVRTMTWLAALTLLLPFLVDQARQGLHPQLEKTGYELSPTFLESALAPTADHSPPMAAQSRATGGTAPTVATPPNPAPEATAEPLQTKMAQPLTAKHRMAAVMSDSPAPSSAPRPPQRMDPTFIAQTGPGIPQWRWHTIPLHWNGPVTPEQTIRLDLVPPWANRLIIWLRILLTITLVARVTLTRFMWPWPKKTPFVTFLFCLLLGRATALSAGEIPNAALLDALKNHLTKPPACLPACADLTRLRLEASPSHLRLHLEVHAQHEVAIPLPGQAGHWLPHEVLLDGKPHLQLQRLDQPAERQGTLWGVVPSGIHTLILEGPLAPQELVQLSLPMPPRLAEAISQGWKVEGIHDNGTTDTTLQLKRLDSRPSTPGSTGPSARPDTLVLPPFLELQRQIELNLNWEMTTRIQRLNPSDSAITLSIPLLAGESVTSEGIRVSNNQIQLRLGPDEQEVQWRSTLEIRPLLTLQAASTTLWREVWRLHAAPWWHLTLTGIPITATTAAHGARQPEWRPWPGEEARIEITRPPGVDGSIVTLERSGLTFTPGERSSEVALTMTLQAGHGGQHAITLPEGAQLISATLAGRSVPIRQEGHQVRLPLAPGVNEIHLLWRLNTGMSWNLALPTPDLGIAGVNATSQIRMPPERWILWTSGPTLGPALLYWGVLLIILIGALLLGRIPWLPLRTRHWLLLGLGLSTVEVVPALTLIAWFWLMGWRKHHPEESHWRFKLRQIFLILWTVAAIGALGEIFRHGLLGYPDMQIAGNHSTSELLQWFQDRSTPLWNEARVYSLPILAYRLLMLVWSLWLAAALLDWIRWGWSCWSQDGIWRSRKPATAIPDDAPHPGVYDSTLKESTHTRE
ncbi:MAG: hypothetical protein G8237_14780 [Magnetococcales bacterium]|nr:hypothetical protein [Magnetococcales bacterium]